MPLFQLVLNAVPSVALLSYCMLLLFFALSKKDRSIRMFIAVLAALIVWTAPGILMQVQLYPGVLFWHRIMIAGMLATPFLIFLFVSVYSATINIYSMVFWGLIAGGSIITDLLGYVIIDSQVVNYDIAINGHHFVGVEFVYTVGPAAYLMFLLMFIMIIAIILKAWKSIKSGNILYDQILLIIVGLSIMFLGTLLNIAPGMNKYPVAVLASLVNAILMIIAIYKYRMLELRFILTRGIVYSSFALIITGLYVYTVFYVEKLTGQNYGKVIPYFTTFTALGFALLFQPIYRLTSKIVDRIFYKAEYTQRLALRNFSSVISNNLDLNSITAELIEAVQLAIRANQVLLLTQEEGKSYKVFQSSSQLFRPDLEIKPDNPIVSWFGNHHRSLSRDELRSSPYFKSMWEKEKRELYDIGVEVIIPIKSRSELIGMMILTRKHNNTAYTLDDLDLLSYLGASTAVAFDNARLFTRSQNEALTDSLTKLHNHRYFFKALSEQMAKVGSSELSILMIDLDLFKLFNDLYGHVEGDKALEIVASILVRNVGQKGIVCRYGGEEFTVLLPYHDTKMAFDVAEKIRLDIERSFFNMTDVTQRFLTASIGVCTYPHAAPNGEELLKRADLAMYTAKNSGKNQTVIYTPEVTSINTAFNVSDDRDALAKPSFTATIYALTAAIDAKDHYTFGHSQKVAQYATILASKLALDKSHIEIIREAALLHDIGKIGIPENILTKTGRLTNEEFEVVKQHVEMSITIIKHLPSLNHVIPAVIGHHERWDGKGYPRGLKGENIPLAARCLSITDAFDAMTSNRPYRACLSVSAALTEIENNIGTQFDPLITNIFIKLVRDGTIQVDNQSPVHIKSVV